MTTTGEFNTLLKEKIAKRRAVRRGNLGTRRQQHNSMFFLFHRPLI